MSSASTITKLKLGLSPRGDERGRHLVMYVERDDAWEINGVLNHEVLHDAEPVRDWDEPRNKWAYRFHMRYLEHLMLAFPGIWLSPGIDKWLIKQERERYEALPVPDITVPGFYDYIAEEPADLFAWQKQAVERIEKEITEALDDTDAGLPPWFMINDDMGLGKTHEHMAAIIRNRWFPALVVAPVAGKYSTLRLRDRFYDDDFTMQIVDGTKAERLSQIDAYADITVVNFETMRVKKEYDKSTREWSIFYDHPPLFYVANGDRRVYEIAVIDEHHKIKTPGVQVAHGLEELQARRWLLLSGTPILNRVEELWVVLNKVDPDEFPTYYNFITRFCIKSSGKIIGYKVEEMRWLRRYLGKHSLRRRTDVVYKDRPQVILNVIDLELTPEQRRLYNEIKEEFLMELEDGTKKNVVNYLAQITRLKQACFSPELYGGSQNSAKVEQLKSDIAELVAAGHKAIIFTYWKKSARIIERELKQYNPAYVDGSVKGKNRTAQEDKFNHDDDCKLYIGTIRANREAITLNAATYIIMTDKDWSPLANKQAIDRSPTGGVRGMGLPPGTKINVIEYHAKDTIEEHIDALLARKQAWFNNLVERDGGVKWKKFPIAKLKDLL